MSSENFDDLFAPAIGRYAPVRDINRKSLEGRQYKIEFWDYMVSIHFTDVRYNPKTFKNEPVTG